MHPVPKDAETAEPGYVGHLETVQRRAYCGDVVLKLVFERCISSMVRGEEILCQCHMHVEGEEVLSFCRFADWPEEATVSSPFANLSIYCLRADTHLHSTDSLIYIKSFKAVPTRKGRRMNVPKVARKPATLLFFTLLDSEDPRDAVI
jgi:hypothetical protein